MNSQTQWISGQWSVASGQWPVVGGRGVGVSCPTRFFSRPTPHVPRPHRCGFTLIELLVTITIIGILAGMVMGVLRTARESARESATRATIAKLNNIIMNRYESYLTRRVPIAIPAGTSASISARMRLDAIRDLMRMEMPDAVLDIKDGPYTYQEAELDGKTVTIPNEPALHKLYKTCIPTESSEETCPSAQCLYLIVSMGSPEAMEQFHESEIGTVTGTDGDGNQVTRRVFVDGWGHPIMWFRCAPGYSNWKGVASPPSPIGASEIQTGNPETDHDPFDPRKVDANAFQTFPLIYSAGPDGQYGLQRGGSSYQWAGSTVKGYPFESSVAVKRGTPTDKTNDNETEAVGCHLDNITNHQSE